MIKLEECPNCESKAISKKYVTQDRHYGIKGDFTLYKCNHCKLVFLNPMFNENELAKFYPESDYYSYRVNFESESKEHPVKTILKKIIYPERDKMYLSRPGSILDIGCGNGWILYKFKKKGWNVAGVEPGKVAAEIGNKANLNIHNGTLLTANYASNQFDYIYSNHSFEHINNPNEVLAEMYKILKPDGKIMIGIPNYNGINSKIAKKYWYYLGAPVHTFNYSPQNIKQILAKHNFKVTSIKYVSTPIGILGSIQIYLNRKSGKKSDEGWVFNSKILRMATKIISKIENVFKTGDCIEVYAIKNNLQGVMSKNVAGLQNLTKQ